jgi:hypothetical protein
VNIEKIPRLVILLGGGTKKHRIATSLPVRAVEDYKKWKPQEK